MYIMSNRDLRVVPNNCRRAPYTFPLFPEHIFGDTHVCRACINDGTVLSVVDTRLKSLGNEEANPAMRLYATGCKWASILPAAPATPSELCNLY